MIGCVIKVLAGAQKTQAQQSAFQTGDERRKITAPPATSPVTQK